MKERRKRMDNEKLRIDYIVLASKMKEQARRLLTENIDSDVKEFLNLFLSFTNAIDARFATDVSAGSLLLTITIAGEAHNFPKWVREVAGGINERD
jgi:hypothetical protein